MKNKQKNKCYLIYYLNYIWKNFSVFQANMKINIKMSKIKMLIYLKIVKYFKINRKIYLKIIKKYNKIKNKVNLYSFVS